jgi:ATP synthase protein I
MGAGFRVVTELIAGVIVGGGLGWLLDHLFHTRPLLMIVLGTLGLVGGFWNIVRGAMLPQRPGSGQ